MRLNAPIFLLLLKSNRSSAITRGILRVPMLMLPVFATVLIAQSTVRKAPGIAWGLRGAWNIEGTSTPIHTGDAVAPGSILQPNVSAGDHSITILLPDGQRIFEECFTPQDCARGFLVPDETSKPDAIAVDMLARVRAVLSRSDSNSRTASHLPQDEAAVELGPGDRIEIAGLAAALQNGRYTYEVRSIFPARALQSGHSVEKTSHNIPLVVPGSGLYEITITDSMKRPRVDLLVAAIASTHYYAGIMKSFNQAHARLAQWNEDNQGWPIHDFQRAYLKSLILGIKPAAGWHPVGKTVARSGVTAEPQFSPRPGTFRADTAVGLRCETPGATIHYTVDESQPFLDSPEYRSSITVKGTLTIKAFASAPGEKDSPVVTGTFRIQGKKD